MLVWLSVWSEVQTCIWPSWCYCHSLSLALVKSTLVLPFWCQLTWVVPDKGLFNGCVCCVFMVSSKKNSWQDRGRSSLCLSLAACIQCVADLGVLWLFTADSLHVVIIAQNTAGMDCFPKSLLLPLHWLPVISRIKYRLATITYKSLSVAQPTYLLLLLQPNPSDPFGQVATTCWHCLHCHLSLADMPSATVHHLFGTSYRYQYDLSTVSAHSSLL